jgi:DNA-binding transcriptional regulator LsrR (DeoR family)/transcriptional regulator with XRE-family HTH domain
MSPDTDDLHQTFSRNLRQQLVSRSITQKELAEAIGRSPALVSCWTNGNTLPRADDLVRIAAHLDVSIDSLLNRQPASETEQAHAGLRWVENIPLYIQHMSQPIAQFLEEEIRLGIRLFRVLVVDGMSSRDCIDPIDGPFPGQSWSSLNRAFKVATVSSALSLTGVARDTAKERALHNRFPHLRQVVVAALPRNMDGGYLESSVIRTELVALLAATHALTGMPLRAAKVGIGPGYTLIRFAQLVIPTSNWFAGTEWIPLTAQRISEDYSYTANQVVTTLGHRCLGSRAYSLPFIEPQKRRQRLGGNPSLSPDTQRALETVLSLRDVSAIFMSVSGIAHSEPEQLVSQNEFLSSDGEHVSRLYTQMYSELQEQGLADQLVGELLGHMFDAEGRLVGLPKWRQSYQDILLTVNYSDLQRAALTSYVWLIAAGHHKRAAVLAAVASKLVNSLVIDADIAEYIIQSPAGQE